MDRLHNCLAIGVGCYLRGDMSGESGGRNLPIELHGVSRKVMEVVGLRSDAEYPRRGLSDLILWGKPDHGDTSSSLIKRARRMLKKRHWGQI